MRYRALVLDDLGVLRAAPGSPVDGTLPRLGRAAGLRVAVLTNADVVDPLLLAHADVVRASGVTGLRKPDPAAYAGCAAALGVLAAECVLVDDVPGNVRAAAAAGMTGVLHRDPATTAEELAALLTG